MDGYTHLNREVRTPVHIWRGGKGTSMDSYTQLTEKQMQNWRVKAPKKRLFEKKSLYLWSLKEIMQIVEKELSRVPRSLNESSNTEVLEVLFDSAGSIMSDIIIYAASSQMKDLFGECWFTINDFCKAMGYERTRLQRKLPQDILEKLFGNQPPIYMTEQNGRKIEHPIENSFEAAIYRLGTSNLVVAYSKDGKSKYKFIQIFDSFEIKDDFSTKKKTKRVYNIHLSKDLLNTLFTEYNLIELKDYRKLPNRKGYRKFYLNLTRMIYLIKYKIEQGIEPCFTATVDQLADIFEVHITNNADRKKKVTSILNAINKNLEVTKFKFQYVKGEGDRWAYTVQFLFEEETLNYFDEKLKAVLLSKYYENLQSEFLKKIGIHISQHYRYKEEFKIGSGQYYQPFIEWAYSEEDRPLKENVYRDTYIKVLGVAPKNFDLPTLKI